MKTIHCLLLFLLTATSAPARVAFDDYFEPRTLRFDFALCGNDRSQTAFLQKFREELLWGGPRKNLIDTSGYGSYYLNVYDQATGRLIYSRGFCTLFDEWRTTACARSGSQSWDNSVVLPWPRNKAVIELSARDRATMLFTPLSRTEFDPGSLYVDRSPLPRNEVVELLRSGDPAEKVDLVFISEGYAAAERDKFIADAERFTNRLFRTSPYTEHRGDFNVRAVFVPSEDSGTDLSGKDIWKNTALNSGFYTFGIDRYLTTPDIHALRDAVWNVPNDALFVLVNTDIYGGGGFYNLYGLGAADNEYTVRVFVHELGHSLVGLADEYFDSEVAYNDYYNLKKEPWEPNITTLADFGLKWRDMLESGTPVPTPVDPQQPGRVGVYEGGGYVSKGIYRPVDVCCMRSGGTFCPVCRRAIERMIRFLCDR